MPRKADGRSVIDCVLIGFVQNVFIGRLGVLVKFEGCAGEALLNVEQFDFEEEGFVWSNGARASPSIREVWRDKELAFFTNPH
jgi:hypothetical protein